MTASLANFICEPVSLYADFLVYMTTGCRVSCMIGMGKTTISIFYEPCKARR